MTRSSSFSRPLDEVRSAEVVFGLVSRHDENRLKACAVNTRPGREYPAGFGGIGSDQNKVHDLMPDSSRVGRFELLVASPGDRSSSFPTSRYAASPLSVRCEGWSVVIQNV